MMRSPETDTRPRRRTTIGDSRQAVSFPLRPHSPAGEAFLELADAHARTASEHAARHDREGTFASEVFEEMKRSGFLTATVPTRYGGLGLDSVHDLTVGLCCLGKADGSTSISANMHLVFPLLAGWLHQVLMSRGFSKHCERLEEALLHLGEGHVVLGNVSEPGTDVAHPLTEATAVDGGWSLSGRKVFSTLAPVADWFVVSCRVRRADGSFAAAHALVPRGCEGQQIVDNWDGLGMRASGSGEIAYDGCFVPGHRLLSLDRDWGADDGLSRMLDILGNIGLLGTYLGIAEAAREHAIVAVGDRREDGFPALATDGSTQRFVAEIEIALVSMRAALERTTRLVDEVVSQQPTATWEELATEIAGQFQCTKLLVNGKAIEVVDLALTLVGGGAYTASHPLARLYRDVRAGPFMQPYSPREAYGFIARQSLVSRLP
jgi:alkylation response protein AidB-like acyl-CoA dehydrogenase